MVQPTALKTLVLPLRPAVHLRLQATVSDWTATGAWPSWTPCGRDRLSTALYLLLWPTSATMACTTCSLPWTIADCPSSTLPWRRPVKNSVSASQSTRCSRCTRGSSNRLPETRRISSHLDTQTSEKRRVVLRASLRRASESRTAVASVLYWLRIVSDRNTRTMLNKVFCV